MEFAQFVNLIRRGWAFVLIATLLGAAAGVAFTLATPRSFAATTTLFVAAQNSGAGIDLQQGNVFALSRVKSYADVVTTDLVLAPVVKELDLKVSRDDLVQMISATVVPDTVIITIAVSASSPQQAADIANALGVSLIDASQQIEAPVKGALSASGISPVKITVVNRAITPAEATDPQGVLKIALGVLAGLAVGLIAALVRGSLDTRGGSEQTRPVTPAVR